MKKKLTSLFLAIAVAVTTVFSSGAVVFAAGSSDYDDTVIIEASCYYDYASQQLELMNEERSDAGSDALVMDADLQAAAMQRAAELALNFSHTRPDGTSCFTVSSLARAENIAAGYSSASAVTSGWMSSSGHKANMLNSSYTTVGIGCVKVGSIMFWVQLFGTGTATTASTSGTQTQYITVNVDYDTVTYEGSGFNLNKAQSDPEPLEVGDTYELAVGILNAGWSGTYAHTSGLGYTWKSSDTSVVKVSSTGLVTAVGTGTAAITATSSGGYSWTKNFSVTETSLSSATVTLSSSSFTYNGAAKKPTVTVKLNGTTLTKGTDYTVSYSNNVNAGTATVTIKGKGDYTGSISKTFTIKQRSINSSTTGKASASLSSSSFTYNGAAKKPSVTLKMKLNGTTTTLTEGTDYTVSYSNNVNAGTATVTIKGTGNFTGTITKTYTIKQRSINSSSTGKATATLSYTSTTYSGALRKPSVTLKMKLNGTTTTLTKGTDYTVSYSGNRSIGKATVTIKGTGNFKGTITKYFTIVPSRVTSISAKSSSSGKITLKWGSVSGSVKYQIAYKKKGSDSWSYAYASAGSVSKTISGLTSGKTYYVKVRAYKKVDGTSYKGSWSSTLTISVK